MAKIIYISGLGHSGSTILDMSLGTLPGVTGLGEVKSLLDPRTRNVHYASYCSCGKKATECEFWKKLPGELKDNESIESNYDHLITYFYNHVGKESVLVDSSKNTYSYLGYLHKHHTLKVIFLTRDIRSWSYSRHLSTGKPVLYFMLRWMLENAKLTLSLRKMKIPFFRAGYEELALYPERILKKITDYTELSFSIDMLTPGKTGSHIISGNIARADADKKQRWYYDARWLLSRRVFLYGPLFLLFNRRNRKFVYSNLMDGDRTDFPVFGTKRKKVLSNNFN